PVGISLNEGLSHMTDREVAILGRKRAFDDDSPLAMPDSMADADVAPVFTSPLDRLRRMGEMVGMSRLVEFAMLLAGGNPEQGAKIMARFDVDEMLEKAQSILGAPASSLVSREAAGESRGQQDQMSQMMMALQALQSGGDAAQSMGAGAGRGVRRRAGGRVAGDEGMSGAAAGRGRAAAQAGVGAPAWTGGGGGGGSAGPGERAAKRHRGLARPLCKWGGARPHGLGAE